MNKELQNSSFFRTQQMQLLNKTVLKMINQKKYPLNYQKFTKANRCKDRYKLSKLHSCPSDITVQSISLSMLPSQKISHKIKFNERSMGEHFQRQNTRHLIDPYKADKQLQEIGNKINNYLWERKKEIASKSSSTERQDQDDISYSRYQIKPRLLRKNSFNNLPTVLRNLRKKMNHEFVKDAQAIELSMYKHQQKDITKTEIEDNRFSFDFLQGREEMSQLMRKYPIKKRIELKQDLNKQMMKEMMEDLKQKQSDLGDKYSKMRIIVNHKKIVSLG